MVMQAPLPSYLSTEILKNLIYYEHYLCCEFDHKNTIIQLWGEPTHLGLPNWTIGTSLDELGLLEGMPMYDHWTLKDVQVSPNHYADIYFSPSLRGKKYLLFVPKTNEVTKLQEYQKFHHQENSKRKKDGSSLGIDTELIKQISKQISAPLSLIQGSTYLLGLHDDIDEKSTAQINVINRAANEMSLLLSNLRDYMYFANNKFTLYPGNVSVKGLVAQVEGIFKPLAKHKGVAFIIDSTEHCPEFVEIDSLRVRGLILNTLNFILYFVNQGVIDVLIDSVDNFLAVTINFETKIKDDLVKVLSESEQHNLSLQVTQNLLNTLGGRFNLDNSDKESVCSLVIPFDSDSETFLAANSEVTYQTEGSHSALLVGRDPITVGRYKSYLSALGLEVTEAGDGQLALAFIEEIPFDMIVTELDLPYISGQEMIKQIRDKGDDIPIIVLSNEKDAKYLKNLEKIGVSSTLIKPINFTSISAEIEKYAK